MEVTTLPTSRTRETIITIVNFQNTSLIVRHEIYFMPDEEAWPCVLKILIIIRVAHASYNSAYDSHESDPAKRGQGKCALTGCLSTQNLSHTTQLRDLAKANNKSK